MIEELVPQSADNREELKSKIKEIEDKIVSEINKFNSELQESNSENNKLRLMQNKAYQLSEKLRKSLKKKLDIAEEQEAELDDLSNKINVVTQNTLELTNTSFTTLQSLYKMHVEYLAQVINGLNMRCKQLENEVKNFQDPNNKNARDDNLDLV